jgi:CheY-like chemotaxis protein
MSLYIEDGVHGAAYQPPCKEVLVVDDDQDICLILREVLEAEGCTVIVAHNGQEALRVLEQRRPDVIVLDLMMPVMNGWELAVQLQQESRWRDIPVVVVSADTLTARRKLAAHVVATIPKPFDIAHIAQAVQYAA